MGFDGMDSMKATMHEGKQIYKLIGQAIGKIGAIGKDNKNAQQGFKYRSIDQVYNALNPVLAELGIFFCPEVIDQKREERTTKNGTALTYTLLTMKYTAFAPDGSNVSMTVVGEGMDSGDKGSNKAMSIAYKYALFQLFCIPTEELRDPDAEVYTDVLPRGDQKPQGKPESVSVSKADRLPQEAQQAGKQASSGLEPMDGETPGKYLQRQIAEMGSEFKEKNFNFIEARKTLIASGAVQDVPSATMTMAQAVNLARGVREIYERMKAAS